MTIRNRAASMATVALVCGASVAATGCGKYSWGTLSAVKSFKDGNVEYARKDWKKAAEKYEDVVKQPGGDRHDVELHVGEQVGDLERMDQIRLARMAHLSLVLVGRKDVGPPEQFDVGVGVGRADLFNQVLEPDHEFWCLKFRPGVG